LNRLVTIAFLFIAISIGDVSCSRNYSRQETIENYKKNEKAILVLADYFWHLKKDSNEVFFEPHSNRYTISIALPNWAISPEHPYDAGRDMKINSPEMKDFLSKLGWSTASVLSLQEMLNKANCKSISSHDDYIQLDYGSDDVCSFWYIISKIPLANSIIEKDSNLGVTFLRNNVRIGSSCAL
jgi:hypothetical protein